MNRAKRTSRIGIIITIIILMIIVAVSNIKVNNVTFVESGLGVLVMPIQNGLTYFKNWIFGNDDFFTNVNNLQEENKHLKEKNSELEQSLRELEIIKSENTTLKEYVNLKEKYSQYETIPGYVINKDISNYSDTIIINLGSKDGIAVNMPVISNEGLVGHVISVTDTTSKVQTIVDTASTISCTITTSRDTLIARGTLEGDSILKATYIPTEATILESDKVETSGLGGIYPKGIYIGTIKKVVNTKNITDRYAMIQTAVDFKKLDTILVITK
ncbi:MAG: rod shape-determining protein MreC [Clostridiaceae bacterium]|nr:rod shape-determining protein MreC [Clostridiaceae bacterium]